MATHSSILACEIPWTEKPGRLESTGSQKSQTRLWAPGSGVLVSCRANLIREQEYLQVMLPRAQVCKEIKYPPAKDYSLILRNKVDTSRRTK